MSKTRRRYVVELTKAELQALIDCAIYGRETFSDDGCQSWKKIISKGDDGIMQLHIAKENGLKTIK